MKWSPEYANDPESEGWFTDSAWLYHLRPESLSAYHDTLIKVIDRYRRLTPAGRRRLKQVDMRCPVKGCLLAEITEFDRREGGVWYFYRGGTRKGDESYDLLNYACACSQALWWTVSCRHGTATMDRSRMMDLFWIADREVASYENEAKILAYLDEIGMRQFWGSRVFHPWPAAWRPNGKNRCAIVATAGEPNPKEVPVGPPTCNSIPHARADRDE